MTTRTGWQVTALVAGLAGGLMAGHGAWAGPCSDDIATLSKQMSENPQLGGSATTGALAGSGPQSNLKSADAASGQPGKNLEGTSAQGKLGGEGGTKEMNAVSNQVATSGQDVRRQQAGLPTTAAAPDTKLPASADQMSRAKMALDQARSLDQKDDASCKNAIGEAQRLMQHS